LLSRAGAVFLEIAMPLVFKRQVGPPSATSSLTRRPHRRFARRGEWLPGAVALVALLSLVAMPRAWSEGAPPPLPPGVSPGTSEAIDPPDNAPSGTPDESADAPNSDIDGHGKIEREDKDSPWKWVDKPSDCEDFGPIQKGPNECRPDGSGELHWYEVSFQEYKCGPDFKPERIATYKKGGLCKRKDYIETQAYLRGQYSKQYGDPGQWFADSDIKDKTGDPPPGGGGGDPPPGGGDKPPPAGDKDKPTTIGSWPPDLISITFRPDGCEDEHWKDGTTWIWCPNGIVIIVKPGEKIPDNPMNLPAPVPENAFEIPKPQPGSGLKVLLDDPKRRERAIKEIEEHRKREDGAVKSAQPVLPLDDKHADALRQNPKLLARVIALIDAEQKVQSKPKTVEPRSRSRRGQQKRAVVREREAQPDAGRAIGTAIDIGIGIGIRGINRGGRDDRGGGPMRGARPSEMRTRPAPKY
jgi:hypothetical protein